jgi:amylosucrase
MGTNKSAIPAPSPDQRLFDLRWQRSEADLMGPLRLLYGAHPKFESFIKRLKALLQSRWDERPADLKDLDLQRDLNPDWFLSEQMVGYVFYIDRFSGNLKGVLKHIDYLTDLGTNYIHFMPCLKPRPGDSDGGYSVMDYRAINPELGTMADLEAVTSELRARGMSTCIDLVLNHTAKEHEWAVKARGGDKTYRDYYWFFDTDEMPKKYSLTLVEIFPETAPGSYTWYDDAKAWVWTTFNEHQWDLNWTNPDVFLEIVDIMLNLANKGAEILRLDAVAFMWKRLGTNCQNQPEVHDILQALRAATRIAAPALIHKAEAIVSPRDLVPYLGAGSHAGKEANLAYHNNLMVQYWSSLATRDVRLMTHVLAKHFPPVFKNASWATYIRCHDDIGWAITDEDGGAVPGMSGYGHRKFLADFYAGKHPGTFARGGIFQENPDTGDRRNSGSFASLAGLEAAIQGGGETGIAKAIDRILLGYALIASFGGLPLLYMGDEIGLLNDHSFEKEPDKAHDNRWMHRPKMDWKLAEKRKKKGTVEERIFSGVRQILERRRSCPQLAASNPTYVFDIGHPSILAVKRDHPIGPLLALFNFSETWQTLPRSWLEGHGLTRFHDALADQSLPAGFHELSLPPYGRVWLT